MRMTASHQIALTPYPNIVTTHVLSPTIPPCPVVPTYPTKIQCLIEEKLEYIHIYRRSYLRCRP